MKTFIKTYELTDQEFEFLLSLQNEGQAEYRDCRIESIEDFRNSDQINYQSEESYLKRNHNGTIKIAYKLSSYGFIEDVEDSWHMTYQLSSLGEEVINQLIK